MLILQRFERHDALKVRGSEERRCSKCFSDHLSLTLKELMFISGSGVHHEIRRAVQNSVCQVCVRPSHTRTSAHTHTQHTHTHTHTHTHNTPNTHTPNTHTHTSVHTHLSKNTRTHAHTHTHTPITHTHTHTFSSRELVPCSLCRAGGQSDEDFIHSIEDVAGAMCQALAAQHEHIVKTQVLPQGFIPCRVVSLLHHCDHED